MDQPHFHKAQCKAEAALLVSMRQRQRRLETTQPGLPSSTILWRSLRLQLMVTLQRLASERKLTLIEAKEMILRTKPQDLSMEEWCWLESACNLVSIMPPLTADEVKHYNLSSYLLKLIPHPGAPPVPSTSTNSTRPLMLISSTANPLSASATPHRPAEVTTSTSSKVALPSVHDLVLTIFQPDPSPTPSSALPYQLATRHPLSAILMAPPCTTARSGSSIMSLLPRPTTRPTMPHPMTSQILCWLGSCGMKELGGSTSQSLTCRAIPNNQTIFRL